MPALVEGWQTGGFGLYIHWPFCEAKCPYCDFNSYVSRTIVQQDWCEAYLAELRRAAVELGGRALDSVYFGGGTPSLLPPETVGRILETTAGLWPLSNRIEITLEANPGSVETERFRAFRQAGINRVSLGVQALNDPDLKALGRLHSAREARAALDIAMNTFDRVSFDLIYARQNQSLPDWEAELSEALSWGADHLSLYQLTIEPGTAFGERFAAGRLTGLPDEDLGADMYEATQRLCEAQGLPAYEVSNHARPGQESRHNMIYWQAGDYLGIGPGAHGRLTLNGQRFATETYLNPATWLEKAAGPGGTSRKEAIAPLAQAEEYAMMSLRTARGTDTVRFEQLGGRPLPADRIERICDLGLISQDGDTLRATRAGRPVLNAVLSELLSA